MQKLRTSVPGTSVSLVDDVRTYGAVASLQLATQGYSAPGGPVAVPLVRLNHKSSRPTKPTGTHSAVYRPLSVPPCPASYHGVAMFART